MVSFLQVRERGQRGEAASPKCLPDPTPTPQGHMWIQQEGFKAEVLTESQGPAVILQAWSPDQGHSQGTRQKGTFWGPSPGLLNQNLGGLGPSTLWVKPPFHLFRDTAVPGTSDPGKALHGGWRPAGREGTR